jgi:hypothetical protein
MDDAIEGGFPDMLFDGVRIVRASRQPCIVCGHPTGDCADNFPAPARIVGDNVEVAERKPLDVLVPENIYEERQITPFTRARVLVAAAGTYVTQDRAHDLGII